MLDSRGFDLWAGGYDAAVTENDGAETYPFAGYKRVMNRIYGVIRQRGCRRVLDLGFGTGLLLKRLYGDGCAVFGADFSDGMTETARAAMPAAALVKHNLTEGLPPEFAGGGFDAIVCTYAIHHLTAEQKRRLISESLAALAPGGVLLIGDVAFETAAELEACRAEAGGEWDGEELYPTAEELCASFPGAGFERLSFCAGVFTLGGD